MKCCRICKIEKDDSHYGKCKAAKDGLAYICHECRASAEQQRRIAKGIKPKPKPMVVDNEHKECVKCNSIYHIDFFPKSKRGRLGRGSYCIECNKEFHKKIRENPEYKNYTRKATQKYRDEHREHWRALHRVNQFNRKNLVKAQSDGTVTEEFMVKLYKIKTCHWCKNAIPFSERTAEHIIPLSRGGIHGTSNLTMACVSCNSSKINFK